MVYSPQHGLVTFTIIDLTEHLSAFVIVHWCALIQCTITNADNKAEKSRLTHPQPHPGAFSCWTDPKQFSHLSFIIYLSTVACEALWMGLCLESNWDVSWNLNVLTTSHYPIPDSWFML